MNKPGSTHTFDVYLGDKLVQTVSLLFVGKKVWCNPKKNQHCESMYNLRPTNRKHHYLSIGKDKREYTLVLK